MSIRNLQYFFDPAAVAVIGASDQPKTPGAVVLRNLVDGGFAGAIFPISRSAKTIQGLPACRRLDKLPRAPELAIIAEPAAATARQIAALGKRGTKAVMLVGPGAAGWDARQQQALLQAARPFLMRLLGPASLGLSAPHANLHAGLTHCRPKPGNIAFIAQSSALTATVLDWAQPRGIGFSHLLSLGAMIDVDIADLLDYLAAEPAAQAILLYLETVTNARKFLSAARAAARVKPVIVVKAKYRHESAVLGADAVYDAAFRRAGMLRVDDMRDFLVAAETLARVKRIRGERLAILTNGAGLAALAVDTLLDGGGRLAELSADTRARLEKSLPPGRMQNNPIDMRDDATGTHYAAGLEALLQDAGVDAVVVCNGPTALASNTDAAQAVIDTIEASRSRQARPPAVLTSWLSDHTALPARRLLLEHGVPTYDTPTDAVAAFLHLARYKANQESLMQTPPAIPESFTPDTAAVRRTLTKALAASQEWLPPPETNTVLAAYGVPVSPQQVAATPAGAAESARPQAQPLSIQIELDPQFGPVIYFGLGGPAAAAIGDRAVALPPLNLHLAHEVMSRTLVYRLLQGGENYPAADCDAIALTLVKLSQLIIDCAEIMELHIDPLLADAAGVLALAARIRIAPAAAGERLAIRPYPQELEESLTLPDGRKMLIRPVRPEDEPAVHAAFARLTPEQIRLRFMYNLRTLTHAMAARYTQIDYDREMALVLFELPDKGEALLRGAVQLSADPDKEKAEFAIIVGASMTGRGLGALLMRRIIDYARGQGIREIFGEVLSENKPMLRLAEALGFTIAPMPEEPGVQRVFLALQAGFVEH